MLRPVLDRVRARLVKHVVDSRYQYPSSNCSSIVAVASCPPKLGSCLADEMCEGTGPSLYTLPKGWPRVSGSSVFTSATLSAIGASFSPAHPRAPLRQTGVSSPATPVSVPASSTTPTQRPLPSIYSLISMSTLECELDGSQSTIDSQEYYATPRSAV